MAQLNKKEQILKTASKLFMQEGFRKVSMDAIAAAVPVSKPTLYNNFSDKKELFAAVITGRCHEFLVVVEESVEENNNVADVLKTIGTKFLSMIISPEAIKINRIVTSECEEFPEMAQLFYESGPKKALTYLTKYLDSQHKRKVMNVPDAEFSANMFLSMLKGQWHMKCVLGLTNTVPEQEQKRIIDYAVALFLKAHSI